MTEGMIKLFDNQKTTQSPIGFKIKLKKELRGRTLLTLIEIASSGLSSINSTQLSQLLDIPPSSLNSIIKRLLKLKYITTFTPFNSGQDARIKNYILTEKGVDFLEDLKNLINHTQSNTVYLKKKKI